MLKKNFYSFIIISVLILASACKIQISSTEKRKPSKLVGKDSVNLEIDARNGELLEGETNVNGYKLVMFRSNNTHKIFNGSVPPPAETIHLYAEKFLHRKRVAVYRLSKSDTAAYSNFELDASSILKYLDIEKVCAFINRQRISKDVYYEAFQWDSLNKKAWQGIYVQGHRCFDSKFIPLRQIAKMPQPKESTSKFWTCLSDSLRKASTQFMLTNDKGIIMSMKNNDTSRPTKVTTVVSKEVVDDGSFSFPFACACDKVNNFIVNIKPGNNGSIKLFKVEGKAPLLNTFKVKVPIKQNDTTFNINATLKAKIKADTTILTKGLSVELLEQPNWVYPFTYGFEPMNYYSINSWIKTVSEMDCNCANQLAFMITQQVILTDSNYRACKLCKEKISSEQPKKTTDEKPTLTKKAPVKAGSVYIVDAPATVMQPVRSDKTYKNLHNLDIELNLFGDYDANANQITFTLLDTSILPNKLEIIDSVITINEQAWNDALTKGGSYTAHVKVRTTSIKDTSTTLQSSFIVIKGLSNSGSREIQVKPSFYDSNKPFWVEIGTNFDLLNSVSTNNLYAGVFMFKKDAAKLSRRAVRNNLSFVGGLYESKSSSFSVTSDSGLIYRDNTSFKPTASGQYLYYRDSGSVVLNSDIQSIGLFFSPHWRITNKELSENGVHLMVSIYVEMLWQRIRSKYDYSKTGRLDTFKVASLNALIDASRFKESQINQDYRSHYYGLGFPLYIKHDEFSLYINTVFGFSNQKFSAINKVDPASTAFDYSRSSNKLPNAINTIAEPVRRWNPFYITQFRLSEETYGISLTGEVRGFLLKEAKPVISFSLSKKFDLGNLLNSVVAPFNPKH